MSVQLYDSATRTVRPLEPVTPGLVRIYLCGATVQGSPHIGHLRAALSFDALVRWLRRRGLEVHYVRNVTDIDDKILTKSAEAGWPWWAWAMRFEREFADAYRTLGAVEPTYEPRATGHIPEQIALVERLIERGHAYDDGAGNVYFSVTSLPDYGSLTRQQLCDLATTEDDSQILDHVEAGKRDPRDFALWKAAKADEPATASWDSPWGRGRPGWHLECSAMSHKYLGETFDIHGGGIDLRFPHHENEQAQSHGAGYGFANMWVHNAWVTTKGEKMSKSLGNSLVVAEILTKVPAPVLRFALCTVHHRSTIEWSEELLESAAAAWERITGFAERATDFLTRARAGAPSDVADLPVDQLPEEFVAAMDDDLNVAGALAVIWEHLKAGNSAIASEDAPAVARELELVRSMLDVLGLDPLSEQWAGEREAGNAAHGALDTLISAMLADRAAARESKDWARADAIRDQLAAAGIVVEDSPSGATWHLA
ncbi:cysteine--tRNA ligase [Bowdeniella massiliensis]|uniref:cysteine--tRNA ligase n=1 Tax=Bowdeniella massiliensis TaxID=2932264 RepID=UPI00202992C0